MYILLTKRIDPFKCDGSDTFWSEGIGTVWHGKSQAKKQQYSERFFELYHFFDE